MLGKVPLVITWQIPEFGTVTIFSTSQVTVSGTSWYLPNDCKQPQYKSLYSVVCTFTSILFQKYYWLWFPSFFVVCFACIV
uniref:Uncharacterized protein n=1 Tax=Arundo donax TaxID=35708 RepID=A0A0A9FAX9_ARUDO